MRRPDLSASGAYQELTHHGVLGMKWGVRRFQNEDGSLTPEGETRVKDLRKEARKTYDRLRLTDGGTPIARKKALERAKNEKRKQRVDKWLAELDLMAISLSDAVDEYKILTGKNLVDRLKTHSILMAGLYGNYSDDGIAILQNLEKGTLRDFYKNERK